MRVVDDHKLCAKHNLVNKKICAPHKNYLSCCIDKCALCVYNMPMLNAEDIKKWLKESKKNRQWLAEKTLTSKKTVDGWLSVGRPIPPAKLALIERLMNGDEEIEFELPPDFEKQLRSLAAEMHKKLEDMVSYILQVTAREYYKNAAKEEPVRRQFTPVETFSSVAEERYNLAIGNIAAGGLQPGDTIPYHVKANRPLGKDEYVLRVEGKSMEPTIKDGALVIMRKHTIPPVPKVGTIVEYNDERGVTLKKLGRRKNPETGKMDYVLHPLNPKFGAIEPMDGGNILVLF